MTEKVPPTEITPELAAKVQAELQTIVDAIAEQMHPEAGKRMKEIVSFRKSITNETDRGAVLMSAAYLDDKLKELIQKRLVQSKSISRRAFEFNGALGTFSSRIDFAYLLGIIAKNAHGDLHAIRGIRNQFAHYAAPLSYEDEKVKTLCDRLAFHGVKDATEAGSKFRRTVMGLLTYITLLLEKTASIEPAPDYRIEDRKEAYHIVSKIFTDITGTEYPLKHQHE